MTKCCKCNRDKYPCKFTLPKPKAAAPAKSKAKTSSKGKKKKTKVELTSTSKATKTVSEPTTLVASGARPPHRPIRHK
jgi:hypothetical protein